MQLYRYSYGDKVDFMCSVNALAAPQPKRSDISKADGTLYHMTPLKLRIRSEYVHIYMFVSVCTAETLALGNGYSPPKHLASFTFNVELNIKTGHFDRSWRLDFLLVYVSSCPRGVAPSLYMWRVIIGYAAMRSCLLYGQVLWKLKILVFNIELRPQLLAVEQKGTAANDVA